tara:strand:- start:1270 stop:1416 length:147 start_codon:yes stop_codon:yes gene_type:complete
MILLQKALSKQSEDKLSKKPSLHEKQRIQILDIAILNAEELPAFKPKV